MKSHPRSRLYVGKQLDAQDELEAITRRQQMTVVTYVPPDKPARDWTLAIAAICIGVVGAAGLVGLIYAIVTSGVR